MFVLAGFFVCVCVCFFVFLFWFFGFFFFLVNQTELLLSLNFAAVE